MNLEFLGGNVGIRATVPLNNLRHYQNPPSVTLRQTHSDQTDTYILFCVTVRAELVEARL
jgi:hypothetical protein